MGEIDTKPIESVQTALSFFGQRTTDQRKNSPTNDEQQEVEKDRELESLMKEIASVKVQLEAKDSAYKQLLLKLDHHQKTADELSTLLKASDSQKDYYINESCEANVRINELESTINLISHYLSESEMAKKQLSRANTDLEAEVAVLREARAESLTKAETMLSALNQEKLRTEELESRISEMKETIMDLKNRAVKIETEKDKYLETFHDLEDELLNKSACISSLEMELKEAKELHVSSKKAASDAIDELEKMKEEMEAKEKKNLDQINTIGLLEKEVRELGNANETLKFEMEKSKEKENDLQIEIALLKFELHKGRSKLAASEAAEARLQSEKSALYTALQDMGLEVEEAKKENKVLRESMKLSDTNSVEAPEDTHSRPDKTQENDEADVENGKENEESDMRVEKGIQVEDHPSCENGKEVEDLKKELEVAMSRIGEFRTRAEQAISRAEAAEKARAALEEKMKRSKEHRERKKAALEALREESVSRDIDRAKSVEHDQGDKIYQPLGKVLNMRF